MWDAPIQFWNEILEPFAHREIQAFRGTSLGGVIIENGGFDWNGSDKFTNLTPEELEDHGIMPAMLHLSVGMEHMTTQFVGCHWDTLKINVLAENAFVCITAGNEGRSFGDTKAL